MAARIKKGDTVLVIAGCAKGIKGEILSVSRETDRAVVQGAAMVKRHSKAKAVGQESGIIVRESSIHLSNLKLVDPTSGKPTRVGFRVLKGGHKVRIAKVTGGTVES